MGVSKRSLAITSVLLAIPLSYGPQIFAAKPIDLSHQKVSILNSIISKHVADSEGVSLKEVSRSTDRNKTIHIRLKENFHGFPVWGGDAVLHIPQGQQHLTQSIADMISAATGNGSMNGYLYLALQKDLAGAPSYIFLTPQAKKALEKAIGDYQNKTGLKSVVSEQKSDMIVYIDDDNVAHWAYLVSFFVDPAKPGDLPARPTFILDAVTFKTFVEWNDLKTVESAVQSGGGFGGNKKMGKLVYDGLADHLAKLSITRDDATGQCSLKNADVTVKHYSGGTVPTFACAEVNKEHNDVYWDDEFHAVNGGYSPDNDALFGGIVIKNMYKDWYQLDVLIENGKPMMLNMVVHARMDNAYWDGRKMTFGDGISMFYPLTSLGVAAHEISHGFTEQNSNLSYYAQSGGMNEAYSDMAAQAAEVFAYGKNSWQIGPEIFKKEGEALRYMDQPSKDCKGKKPGNWCSIDDASQYYSGLDVHFSSGVYNRFFYLLGNTEGWTARKAFDVMVHANVNYWTPRSTFVDGACGSIKAAKDLGYETKDVIAAFEKVKVDTSRCA